MTDNEKGNEENFDIFFEKFKNLFSGFDLSDEKLKDFAMRCFENCDNPTLFCICGSLCEKHLKYCGSCGRKNLFFDESELIIQWGTTVIEYKNQECDKGHPSIMNGYKENIDLYIDYPFCDICGKKLF